MANTTVTRIKFSINATTLSTIVSNSTTFVTMWNNTSTEDPDMVDEVQLKALKYLVAIIVTILVLLFVSLSVYLIRRHQTRHRFENDLQNVFNQLDDDAEDVHLYEEPDFYQGNLL